MRVNLLEKDEGVKINWIEIVVVLLIIFVFALPLTNYYLNYLELNNLKQNKKSWENRLNVIEPKKDYYNSLKNEIADFKLPAKVELEKYTVSPFFIEFSKIIGQNITFKNLDYSSGIININGNAKNLRSLLDFTEEIYKSNIFSITSLDRFQNNDQLEFNLEVQLDKRDKGVIHNE